MKLNGRSLSPIKDNENLNRCQLGKDCYKGMKWREFLKRIKCLLACCNSQIIVENSQLDGKPENDQGETTEENLL